MNLNQLKYFVAVAEHQNFTKAATQHYISQTAITQQVHALEESLGVKLVDRNTRPITLTPAGQVFLMEARAILATTYVADGDYYTALEQAQMVLEKNDKHASALATAAISCGLTGDPVMCKHYTTQAVENGYSKKKIEDTIAALKKR